ncbi:MAG: hypothetical protein ABIS21_02805 [Acidimicrobiales bacterium]
MVFDGSQRALKWTAAALAAVLIASLVVLVARSGDEGGAGPATNAGPTTTGVVGAGTTESTPAPAPGAAPSTTPDAPTGPGVGTPPTPGPGTGSVPASPAPAAPAPTPSTSRPDSSGREWVRVGALTGTASGTSPAFRLAGVDTRLVYRSEAGSFTVFVVDEARGLDATAGFADLECDRPCAGEMVLVNQPGAYRLEVRTAGGPYEVVIEEYRRPGR